MIVAVVIVVLAIANFKATPTKGYYQYKFLTFTKWNISEVSAAAISRLRECENTEFVWALKREFVKAW